MKIFNTITRKKEEFIPIDGKNVKIYACGVTVYDLSHIGHARQAIVYSMIVDYMRYRGYNVKYVRNYTDVDDKIINKANQLKKNALEFSKEQIQETEYDMNNLHVTKADIYTLASEHIEDMINFVQGLIDNGHAYVSEYGDVYFDVRSFKEYGKLSNRNIDELINGVRKDIEPGKKDPIDFALWKSTKPGEIFWTSPWGNGRPGWHIECSAMVLKHLGETIDIHGGGKDLIFPHHENEIAQSEALTGKKFAKYWSHCGLVKINGQKMSKSLGNSLTIRDALKKYNFEVIKYVMFSKHYTSDIDISDYDFIIAQRHVYYFYTTIMAIEKYIEKYTNTSRNEVRTDDISDNIISNFISNMDDDFNTSAVIADLFSIFKYTNNIMNTAKNEEKDITANTLNKILTNIKEVYGVMGFFTQNAESFINEIQNKFFSESEINKNFIEKKINERKKAKKEKNFALADSIRDELDKKGIILKDTPNETIWDIKILYTQL